MAFKLKGTFRHDFSPQDGVRRSKSFTTRDADSGRGNDFSILTKIHFGHAPNQRFLIQGQMRSVFVVVSQCLFHQPLQMLFIQHNHMIEQVLAAVANPAFCAAVLSRASEAGPFGFDA